MIRFSDLSFMETLLCKVKLCLAGRQLGQLLPLLLAAGLFGQPVGSVEVAKLDGQVKPVDREFPISSTSLKITCALDHY